MAFSRGFTGRLDGFVTAALATATLFAATSGCTEVPSDQASGVGKASSPALAVTNGLSMVNGLSMLNGLSGTNGLAGTNGLSMVNGLSSTAGLASASGLMTTKAGRRTVSYLARCALNANDSLVKADQYGTNYTFPGGLGLAPGWKTGSCDQNCQELISACLMAHVNSYGVHYPIWVVAAAPAVGWGLPPSNYQMEGTFFGNIMISGAMNHGATQAPWGYYCDGTGLFNGVVAGRLGDVNATGAAPYYNSYPGLACATSNKCISHTGGDGFTSCTDANGSVYNNLVTVWRDPNAPMTFDSGYGYSLRPIIGSRGLALSPPGGNYANWTQVQQLRYVHANKIGIADSGAGNGTYKLFFWDNPSKCIENPGSQTANGTQVQIWDCNGSAWQQWQVIVDVPTGATFFKNMGSGKCMDDAGSTTPTAGAPWIWDCSTSNVNQKWRMTGGYWRPTTTTSAIHSDDAYVVLAGNGEGNVAIDSAGNYTNGTKLRLAGADDTNINDEVSILPGTSNGTWIIKFAGGGGNKCLDNPNSSTTNGTSPMVYDCNGGTNQNWIITNNPTGGVMIKNQAGGKCLDNQGVTAAGSGSAITQWDCSTTSWNQMWGITVLDNND